MIGLIDLKDKTCVVLKINPKMIAERKDFALVYTLFAFFATPHHTSYKTGNKKSKHCLIIDIEPYRMFDDGIMIDVIQNHQMDRRLKISHSSMVWNSNWFKIVFVRSSLLIGLDCIRSV